MNKLKIILADDAEILNRVKKDYLSKLDYIDLVDVASNGYEEYQMIKSLQPDVAITDNQMPNMNGTDVIEKVTEDDEIKKKPLFIIVSADNLDNYAKENKEKNVFCAIRKGFDLDALNENIEDALFEIYNILGGYHVKI